MGKPYSMELDQYYKTINWASRQDTTILCRLLSSWAADTVAVVGSGGSFSAAYVIARFRELAHRTHSVYLSPMAFFDFLLSNGNCRSILLSAEGKNTDILAACSAARSFDIECAALTFTQTNPLTLSNDIYHSLRLFTFDMPWGKDGYLATNTLVGMVALFYKALLGDTDYAKNQLSEVVNEKYLQSARAYWSSNIIKPEPKDSFLVLYDYCTASFAVDFESKISESALGTVQLSDFRQFAHGRHFGLSLGDQAPTVIAIYSPGTSDIAQRTIKLFPPNISVCERVIYGVTEMEILFKSLVEASFALEAISKKRNIDPGQPSIEEYGRLIHSLSSSNSFTTGRPAITQAAFRKRSHMTAGSKQYNEVISASEQYFHMLKNAKLKALACDFDGTLCFTEKRYDGMDLDISVEINRVLESGIRLVVASGRGKSLWDCLRKSIDPRWHKYVWVGYRAGSIIQTLDKEPQPVEMNKEFEELYEWLQSNAYFIDSDLQLSDYAKGGQFTYRLKNIAESKEFESCVRSWIDRYGKQGWRVYRSGHSIDILDPFTSKSNVISHAAKKMDICSHTEVLRIGDSGHEMGNDYELLNKGISLSVDRVSSCLDSCWNFAPSGQRQASACLYYLRNLHREGDHHKLSLPQEANVNL